MSGTADPATMLADVQQLRERVRADRRTVTAPLLVFGLLILAHAVAVSLATATAGGPRHSVNFLYWPLAGAVGLGVLWWQARRIATRDGVGEGRRSYRPVTLGYVVSVPLLALMFLPVFFFGVFAPLVWPAGVLYAIARRQHSQALRRASIALAVAAVPQVLLVMAALGPAWLGVDVAAGLALIVVALVLRARAAAA
ncbi:hypothetical protein [Catenuloplanes atrovinosus]|uniref:Uncharacterized protein n=1 Tax=Catenuloplanes atrovinosus TaxID=137266 RepID=A0AAE3YRK0_9ACTN|nr:hypothetical protein [Catenuloplanes atrovinosus]MDR7277351.1 hypothetical protein [Catenuloplanes atrovinosus]